MRRAIAGAALLGAFCAASCGGPSAEEKRAERAQRVYQRDVRDWRQDVRRWEKDQALYESCQTAFSDLIDAAQELDGRLDVGLTFSDYSSHVGDVSVAYKRADFDVDIECLSSVGLPLEKALNHYSKAYNAWNECIDDLGCDVDSIDSELQGPWSKATVKVDEAVDGLDDLDPGEKPPRPRRPPEADS